MSKINIIKVSNTEAQEKEVYSRKEANLKFGAFRADSVAYMYNRYIRNPNVVPYWQPPRAGNPLPWDFERDNINHEYFVPTGPMSKEEAGKIADGMYSFVGINNQDAFNNNNKGADSPRHTVIASKGNYFTMLHTDVPRAFLYNTNTLKDIAIDTYGNYDTATAINDTDCIFIGVSKTDSLVSYNPMGRAKHNTYYEKKLVTIPTLVSKLTAAGLSAGGRTEDPNTVKYTTDNNRKVVTTDIVRAGTVTGISSMADLSTGTDSTYKWDENVEILVTAKTGSAQRGNYAGTVCKIPATAIQDKIDDTILKISNRYDTTKRAQLVQQIQSLAFDNSPSSSVTMNDLVVRNLTINGLEKHNVVRKSGSLVDVADGQIHEITLNGKAMLVAVTNTNCAYTTGVIKVIGAKNITGYGNKIVLGVVPTDLQDVEIFTYFTDGEKVYLSRI